MRQHRLHGRLAAMIATLAVALYAAPASYAASKGEDSARKSSTANRTADAGEAGRSSGRKAPAERGANGAKLDRSGRAKVGKASFYAHRFAGRKMADGTPMKPAGANAASKTLPLGTVAKVTNLENGASTQVTIQDRGPYVSGRIIDLPPSKAQEIGITHKNGVAPVEVAPIAVPKPDGGVKPGDGAGTDVALTRPRELSR